MYFPHQVHLNFQIFKCLILEILYHWNHHASISVLLFLAELPKGYAMGKQIFFLKQNQTFSLSEIESRAPRYKIKVETAQGEQCFMHHAFSWLSPYS